MDAGAAGRGRGVSPAPMLDVASPPGAGRGAGRGRGRGGRGSGPILPPWAKQEDVSPSVAAPSVAALASDLSSSNFEDASSEAPASSAAKPDASAQKPDDSDRTLFVGNVPESATADELKSLFADHGSVYVRILTDRDTGAHKGAAFVKFDTPEAASAAFAALKGSLSLGGVALRLDPAKPKKKAAPENFAYASSARRWDLPAAGEKAVAKDEDLEKVLFSGESSGINFSKYSEIKVEVVGEDLPPPASTFAEMQLDPLLAENVQLAGYTTPTPVQQHSIPIALAGRDMMACAQTGSGKTAAYLFPALSRILARGPYEGEMPPEDPDRPSAFKTAYPEILVLAPTRELASQIFDEACKFSYRSFARPCAVYGGADIGQQQYEVEKGCTVLVATPGRLVAMRNRGSINLGLVKYVVLDEADRMLDMGFEKQIREILEDKGSVSMETGRQTVMFSATFPEQIQRLARDFMREYVFVKVGRVGSTSTNITQKMVRVDENRKREALLDVLRAQQPGTLTLVFVNSKLTADALDLFLRSENVACTSLHGDLQQWEREEALRFFKDGSMPVLVATDVAARGIDIPNVAHVINFDLPKEIDDYVHRIGRTGRVGRTGLATSFVGWRSRQILPALTELLAETNQEVPSWFTQVLNDRPRYDRSGPRTGGRGGGGGGGRGRRGGGSGEPSDADFGYGGGSGGGRGRNRGPEIGQETDEYGDVIDVNDMKAWDRKMRSQQRFSAAAGGQEKRVYASTAHT